VRGVLLDTHIWIWYVAGSSKLSPKVRKVINDNIKEGQVFISAISVWEVSMLETKDRIVLGMPLLEWVQEALEITGIQLVELTPTIAIESTRLPGEFHSDPADRIIVASARVDDFLLITRDDRILNYSSNSYVSTLKG